MLLVALCWLVEAVTKWVSGSTPETQALGRIAADAARQAGWPLDAITLFWLAVQVIAVVAVAVKRMLKGKRDS